MNTHPHFTLNALNRALLVGGLLGLSGYVAAQQIAAPKQIIELEEILITGQKITRTQQQTPTSVEVVREVDIDDNPAVSSITDALQTVANVDTSNDRNFSIRGINRGGPTNNYSGADTYNMTVDGATQTNIGMRGNILSAWDVRSIEVLRGPQSTTAGRNALAGAIVVNSNDPEFTSNGRIQVKYGSYNTASLGVVQTGPISEQLAYRLSAEHQYSDGFTTNTLNNDKRFAQENNTSLRGKLLFQPNEGSEVLLTVSHGKRDEKGNDKTSLSERKFITRNNLRGFSNTDVSNVSLQYKQTLSDDWTLHSTTAYSRSKLDRTADLDGESGIGSWGKRRKENALSQEIRFNYDSDALNAVVGVYAGKGNEHDENHSTNYQIKFGKIPVTINLDNLYDNNYRNFAAFINADYKFTQQLTVLGGLRYDYDTRDEFQSPKPSLVKATGNPAIDQKIKAVLQQANGEASGKHSGSVLLPKIGLDYAWSNQLSSAVVYQRGYRPGGVSTNPVRGTSNDFNPEFTDNIELSIRFSSDDKRFTANANLFYTNWKDQQVTVKESAVTYDTYVTNAARSTLYGVELTGQAQVHPDWRINAGIGYTHSEFKDFINNGEDLSGKAFPNAPKLTANLGATYRNMAGWFGHGNVSYRGKAYDDVANTEVIKPYTVVNLKAGYEADDWSAYGYVNNVFNKLGYDRAEYPDGTPNYTLFNAPRTVGVQFGYYW